MKNGDAVPFDKQPLVVYMFMSMKLSMDSQQASQQEKEESKNPGFRNLVADTQQLILNASAVLPFEYMMTKPTDFLQKFLEEKTFARASIILQKKCKKEKLFLPQVKD